MRRPLRVAAQVAVGTEYNALFAVDDDFATAALQAAKATAEPLWRLPLAHWHQENCPSAFADTANSKPIKGGGSGGASNASGFLLRFAPNKGQGWVHFDLAGAYQNNANGLWAAWRDRLRYSQYCSITDVGGLVRRSTNCTSSI